MNRLIVLGILLIACGGRVTSESDASTDGGASSSSEGSAGGGVACGPNTCRAGETCCNAKCGVCSFPDECVVHDCGGP